LARAGGGKDGVIYYIHYISGGDANLQDFETRASAMLGYQSKDFSALLGTNTFKSGKTSQRTGMIFLGSGDFHFNYENDGAPFAILGGSIVDVDSHGKNTSDGYRTAALSIGIGDWTVETRMFTGYRDLKNVKQYMEGQEYHDRGWVGNPEINDYRAGIVSIGYKGYKAGWDNDYFRHVFQNRFAHGCIKPQAYIPRIPLSRSFFEYRTPSQFTHW
jgi:Bacterial toxin 23